MLLGFDPEEAESKYKMTFSKYVDSRVGCV